MNRKVVPAMNRKVVPAMNRKVVPAMNRNVVPAMNHKVVPAWYKVCPCHAERWSMESTPRTSYEPFNWFMA
jgi:hypothetical protein